VYGFGVATKYELHVLLKKLNKNNQQMFAMMFFFKASCCTLQNIEKAQERKIIKKGQN
jgi:hypothetical protein